MSDAPENGSYFASITPNGFQFIGQPEWDSPLDAIPLIEKELASRNPVHEQDGTSWLIDLTADERQELEKFGWIDIGEAKDRWVIHVELP